jgi:hypothetical protein
MSLFSLNKIPVLLSSTFDCKDNDIYYDFDLDIDENTGVIFQKNIPPQNILYKNARNSGMGKVWDEHYNCFYNFIIKNINLKNKNICEIGSGNGVLAKKISNHYKITCYEPSPCFEFNNNLILKKQFFNKNITEKYDIIISSHTLEHMENVNQFLIDIHNNLNENGFIIMSFPNFEIGLIKNFINIFNTEHISYFTPDSAKRIFNKNYYQNCILEEYKDHSLFIIGQKNNKNNFEINEIDIKKIKNLIQNYEFNIFNKVNKAIQIINQRDKNLPLYIFGCHAMTSIFLHISKINHSTFNCILDNDPLKTNSRLYGTDLKCKLPKDVPIGYVLLNGAAYHDEIKNKLINDGFKILEWI